MHHRTGLILVDDDADLAEALGEYLSDLGYEVRVAPSAAACERLLARAPADLLVLDIAMPGEDGLDFLRRVTLAHTVAVLVLTGSADHIDRIVALESGATDVVAKPVEPQELAARIRGILDRRGVGAREIIRLERCTVDLTASCLLVPGCPPERLGPGEVVLLRALVRHPDRVLGRDELIEMAPADALDTADRAIDSRIARLRRKLGTTAIETVRGYGYRFVPPFG